jgi:type I restriction enzyme S subunit
MKADQLRKSILQMAIQGKLVAQNPTDEPASVLLERIQAEKQKLIKEGKLKKDKYDSIIFKGDDNRHYEKIDGETVDIEDEIPFEIPESWRWVRMETIGDWGAGATPLRTNPKYFGGDILWLKTGELNNGYIYDTTEKITNIALKECSLRVNKIGDILIAMYGATIGKLAIVGKELTTNQACCACTPYKGIYNLFLFYYLLISKDRLICLGDGGAQPNISREKLINFLIPIPSFAEQERIVLRIKEFEPIISEYDHLEQEKFRIDTELSDRLRKSILQYAIQGKLVPQDPADEPASVLLERIRKEKKTLINQGKIKRDKADSYIYRGDDNSYYQDKENIDSFLPFDIPENWHWIRLGNVINLISGQDLTPDKYNENKKGIPYITGASNIKNENVIVNRWTNEPKAIAKQNNLLLTCKGTVGELAFLEYESAHIARQIMAIQFSSHLSGKFVKIFIETYIVTLQAAAKSMIPGISREDVLNAYFPLPPLAEQKRIVKAVNALESAIKFLL